MENRFEVSLPDGGTQHIKNTNCIIFHDADFEAFCEMRDVLKNGYTDDIWESITELFEERFMHDRGLLSSEIV